MKAVDLLIKSDAPLQIAMTVKKKNIHDIGAMTKKFGSRLTFAPLFVAGRAKAKKELSITGKEYYQALSSVDGVNPLSNLCSSLVSSKQKPIMKCAFGDAEISISDTGDVYPCQLHHFPQFYAGNIKKQSLRSIYENSESLKSCRELTVLEVAGCKTCDIRFFVEGDVGQEHFMKKDDWMFLVIFVNTKNWHILTAFLNYMSFRAINSQF